MNIAQNHETGDILDTHSLLVHAGVVEGMTVADCGSGAEAPFSIAAAKIVGPHGIVYALDVVKSAIARIAETARRHNVENVQPIWTDLEMYGAARAVRNESVDVAVLANTLFQSQDHAGMFTEIARMLKKGGKLLVVDWSVDAESVLGPPKSQRVSSSQVQQFAQVAGLTFVGDVETGEYHWAALFTK